MADPLPQDLLDRCVLKVRSTAASPLEKRGICAACGALGDYKYAPVINDELARQWGLDAVERRAFSARESMACPECGCTFRLRQLARAIAAVYGGQESLRHAVAQPAFQALQVAEINSCGGIHGFIKHLPNLHYSEYGSNEPGVRDEDLMALTYEDNSMDLVLTSETLEHIPDPARSLSEIYRVLKPGGWHIFTIPVRWTTDTVTRARLKGGTVELAKEASYHGAGQDDYLVFTEFGRQAVSLIEAAGFEVRVMFANERDARDPGCVFVTRKPGGSSMPAFPEYISDDSIGSTMKQHNPAGSETNEEGLDISERMVPEFHEGNMIYAEHIARYEAAAELVEGKEVLDIASGSGYGTAVLGGRAKRVVGVDISQEAIEYSKEKYPRKNVEYLVGSATEIPLKDASMDVVVSFETIEHVDEPEKFLSEVRRVLKSDGLLVISTPNKEEFAEGNHFHVHEYTLEELQDSLKKRFKYTRLVWQATWNYTAVVDGPRLTKPWDEPIRTIQAAPVPEEKGLYFLLLASNRRLNESVTPIGVIGQHWSAREVIRKGAMTHAHVQNLEKIIESNKQFIADQQTQIEGLRKQLSGIVASRSYQYSTKLSAVYQKVKRRK